jgi:LysM repeat protein
MINSCAQKTRISKGYEPQSQPTPSADKMPRSTPAKLCFYVHKISWSGETLSHIARWYTGSTKNLKAIVKVNPGINPKLILIGDKILIPEELLKTRQPMPREFLAASVRKKDSFSSSPEQPSEEPEGLELFYPIDTYQPTTEPEKLELFEPVD